MPHGGKRQADQRTPSITRRALLKAAAPTGFAAAIGMPIPFLQNLQAGIVPIALAQNTQASDYGKNGLVLLNDRPVNMETPAHLLDDKVTPANRFFVRNNGLPPFEEDIQVDDWMLGIDGEVENELRLSISELKSEFETISLQLQLECGGNGRKFYTPGASGNQWSFGAIGCAEWTGVRLKDVLERAGPTRNAIYTAHFGADMHLTGDPQKQPLSRGVPLEKALDPHNLIAWAMNGNDIPLLNGHPLRLIVPGWPGSCSQKWLTQITLRDQVHDGAKMTGKSYRVPAYSVAPGTEVPDEDMVIIESMPVKSIITAPETGKSVEAGNHFSVRGHAWAGDLEVAKVELSIDFGATWSTADLEKPANKFAWQHFAATLALPQAGYYEIWARATDTKGKAQPAVPPNWNPKGYLNNMQHRVAVFGI